MSKEKCAICGERYTHGSGLYNYYACGHVFEKPLNNGDIGKWTYYESPYNSQARDSVKNGEDEG